MTLQIRPTLIYNNKKYTISDSALMFGFEPQKYGFKPKALCTACWDGFLCQYCIHYNMLCLDSIDINESTDFMPILFGKSPSWTSTRIKGEGSQLRYTNLKKPFDYTGSLIIVSDYLENNPSPYIHKPGYNNYKTMLKLTFKSSILTNVIDLSLITARIRNYMDTHDGERPNRSLYRQINYDEKYSVINNLSDTVPSCLFPHYTIMKTLKE